MYICISAYCVYMHVIFSGVCTQRGLQEHISCGLHECVHVHSQTSPLTLYNHACLHVALQVQLHAGPCTWSRRAFTLVGKRSVPSDSDCPASGPQVIGNAFPVHCLLDSIHTSNSPASQDFGRASFHLHSLEQCWHLGCPGRVFIAPGGLEGALSGLRKREAPKARTFSGCM